MSVVCLSMIVFDPFLALQFTIDAVYYADYYAFP